MSETFLTVKEVADILRVSRKTVLKFIHTRKIRALKMGKDWRIPKGLFMEWIEKQLQMETDSE